MKLIYFIIPFCNGFCNNKLLKRKPLRVYPTEVIDEGVGFGDLWSYTTLLDNIKEVDSVSLFRSNNEISGLVVFDNNELHRIQYISELKYNIIEVLTNNHIPFNFKDMPVFNYNVFELAGLYFIISLFLNNIFRQNPMSMIRKSEPIKTNISFKDVAGCDEAKIELVEIVDFLKDPTKYKNANAKIPKGVLLEGSPGTGKTLLAKAVAGEANVPFFYASGSQFIEMFVGVGASRVRELFETAKKSSPCIIFLDEIDAIGKQRGGGFGNEEREQTLNQILTNMDGFIENEGVVVIAATNRMDILDSALTRPGRFDRKIKVGLPDQYGRKDILNVHFKDKKLSSDVNFDQLSYLLTGFSGADIANLANEAAILSVRYNETQISSLTIMNAFEKIVIGLPTLKETRSESVLKMVSYHEIGHTMVINMFKDLFMLQKVTIQSNKNGAGGYTVFLPKQPYDSFPSKKFLLANIMISLGGRVAEQKFFKNNTTPNIWFEPLKDLDVTTGASNDLKQARQIAINYINLFGSIGRYDYLNDQRTSEYLKSKMDKEVEDIILFCYKKVEQIFDMHEETLHIWANELYKEKTLNQTYFQTFFL